MTIHYDISDKGNKFYFAYWIHDSNHKVVAYRSFNVDAVDLPALVTTMIQIQAQGNS